MCGSVKVARYGSWSVATVLQAPGQCFKIDPEPASPYTRDSAVDFLDHREVLSCPHGEECRPDHNHNWTESRVADARPSQRPHYAEHAHRGAYGGLAGDN